MNNQEPQSRVKRYDFNKGSKRPNKNPKNFKVWPWILGLVIVIGLLVGGIKVLTAHDSGQSERSSIASSSSHTSNSNNKNNGSSVKKAKQASSSDKKQNQTASNNQHTPSGNTASNQPTAGNGSTFDSPRQFSSVADATSWAKATQSSWLKDGYNNYTITSDGQGYYVLTFTK